MTITRRIHVIQVVYFFTITLKAAHFYVSLGDACAPALNLKKLNFRREAYPFDWIVSPFDSLVSALEDDFKHFLTDLKVTPNGTGIEDYYGFVFLHDFPTVHHPHINALNNDFIPESTLSNRWEAVLPNVIEKYKRRVNRFNELCCSGIKIYFIRDNLTYDQALILQDVLKRKYHNLDLTLISVMLASGRISY